jgi:hypothetical protein
LHGLHKSPANGILQSARQPAQTHVSTVWFCSIYLGLLHYNLLPIRQRTRAAKPPLSQRPATQNNNILSK